MSITTRLQAVDLNSPWHVMRRLNHMHSQRWYTDVSSTVTRPQFTLLTIIAAEPGHDQQTVGTLAALDKNTTANVVARLQEAGLVQRTSCANDKRRRLLTITPEGDRVLQELWPRIRTMEQVLEEHLAPEDREHLRRILNLLVDQHEPAHTLPTGGFTEADASRTAPEPEAS
ncbi:MarR family winged helix-turn-helix transcriptional regulator [Deinococcus sp. Leaf326]|uniref:MarR family winged helix-turn-helix transcriptional regulator n=1 Tax=Deinococcus sp. Leaf326 TaxID=1736338 RepID=UPI0006F541F1|nr:MarR family transcriptional regulator [Deinococcus sp. Leaf326]KQR03950.1 hypothetical protein ASF71_21315 [Deinococcus sp. Leaf326]